MKKSIFLFILSLLLLSCSSVKQTRQAINTGNYDRAINTSIEKLRKNKYRKGNQPHILLLKEAFDKAVSEDNEQIRYLKMEGNSEKIEEIEEIYSLYLRLDKRQKEIQPLLPLKIMETGENVVFDFENYQDKLVTSKKELVEHLYSKALFKLKSENTTKLEFREVYDDFKYVNRLSPNYKKVNSLLKEAHAMGTDLFYVTLKNETEKVIPKRLEEELLNFDTYKLNDFWTVYHSKKDDKIDYDYELQLNFRNIIVSPERVKEKELIKEKEIEEKIYVKDSLGNKTESIKRLKVICTLHEITQMKTCDIVGNVKYISARDNQVLESFPLASGFTFTHIYGNYVGDKRALATRYLNMIQQKEVPFPSNEEMIYDAGKDLKDKLKRIIVGDKFR